MTSYPLRTGPALRVARDAVLVAALYVAAAQLAFLTAVVHGTASPVWPPTAVALVALLWRGPRILPGVALGVVVANATRPVPAGAVAMITVVNTLEPVVTVWVLRRLRGSASLVTVRDVGVFLLAVSGGALVSAAGGTGALCITGLVTPAELPEVAALWALGNIAGAACAAPLVLVPRTKDVAGRLEGVLVLLVTALVGYWTLSQTLPHRYVLFPILIWAGLRLGPRRAAAVTLLLSALTVSFAARGEGPFVHGDATTTLLTSQGFVVVTALTTLFLAAITEDRRRAGAALVASEREKRELADEQAALRRVATAIAEERPADQVFALVAREVAGLAGTRSGVVVRDGDGGGVVGAWGPQDGAVVRAAIQVDGRRWGAVGAGVGTDVPAGLDERLARFAELVAISLTGAEHRARLTAQATSDPLTGLLNHRAFHERLREEVERARRHGRDLAVAVFDLDHFKQVNDTLGHGAGDEVLQRAAERLRHAARRGEPVGRVGGDELAVIMPEVGGLDAFTAADRLRRAIGADRDPRIGPVSCSAGTCDLTQASDADALLRLADGALYWAKAHGRDVCFRYTPEVVAELSATERAERLARSQALSGIRALARAIDAKDRSTTQHSERVAELAARLAAQRGWADADVARLREAGLVHDVGKIGVPDAVLFKPGRLTAEERVIVERHAELGAQIASEVLDPEQVAWIHAHHEHVDGAGYPRGLAGDAVPEGARLLALADAWDAMTKARPYSTPMTPEAAYRECRRQAGRQFCPQAVAALDALWAGGLLTVAADAVGEPSAA